METNPRRRACHARRLTATRAGKWLSLALLPGVAGCDAWVVDNAHIPTIPPLKRHEIRSAGQAVLQRCDGVNDADWLVIQRPGGSGEVGGFLSREPHRGGLVVLLGGASTFDPLGRYAATRNFYQDFGIDLRRAGFLLYAPVLAECGTPYGGEDLAQTESVLDWLEGEGKAFLGVERVYVVGYSTGGTLVNMLNPRRQVTAMVALCGLAESVQFEAFDGFYRWLAARFPNNAGFCQLASTLDAYGPPGSIAWYKLDAVARVGRFRNPTLYVHGDFDWVYVTANTRHIEAQYRTLRRAGRQGLPPLKFIYIPLGDHFSAGYDRATRPKIVRYLRSFEPR